MRRIFSSTIMIGGATLAAILVGVARSKVLALWVGPAGIGLLGIFSSIVTFAATLMHFGFPRSGVHQIATHRDEPSDAIRALVVASWLLAIAGAVVVWLLRDPISRLVTGSAAHATGVGIAALGVTFLILSGSQLAILQGLRRVSDQARVRVIGAVIGSLLAILSVYYFGTLGLALVVVLLPLGDFVVGRFFVARLKLGRRVGWPSLRRQWSEMFRFGMVSMAAGIMTSSTAVFVRAILADSTGLTGAGLYQAAYSISIMNVSLVLTALAADYFPNLTSIIDDRHAANRLANQQFHAALLMATPLIVGMGCTAPYVLTLLFSSEFTGASLLLLLHTIGDLFKLLAWTLGAVLLAKRDLKAYLFVETIFTLIYILATYFLVDTLSENAAGVAYCLAYMAQTATLVWFCKARHGISISGRNLGHFGLVAAIQISLLVLVLSGRPVLAIGLAATAVFGVAAVIGMARATDWHNAFAMRFRKRS